MSNATYQNPAQPTDGQPLEIFLLQQQFTSPGIYQAPNTIQILHNTPGIQGYFPNLSQPTQENTSNYKVHDPKDFENNKNELAIESSTPLQQEGEKERTNEEIDNASPSNPVQVYSDHNCTEEDGLETLPKSTVEYEESTKFYAETPSFTERNSRNHGSKPSSSKTSKFNERKNSRSERLYFVKPRSFNQDGISKLVASTKDLISNEDLLIINHAIEKEGYVHNDDLLNAKSKSLKTEQSRRVETKANPNQARSRITLRAKVGNIVNSEINHKEENHEEIQTSSNEYKFANPIVVQDSTVNDYKEQIMSNLVSSIAPYLDNGYELKSVKNTLEEGDSSNKKESNADNVTPHPVGQKYLAAITVGLRLVNANDTDILNSVEDHEGSDSEVISETVPNPERERTIVEIQKSIPLAITHINDVVVHEWNKNVNNDEPFEITKSLHEQHNEALASSRKIQQHMNKNLYLYGTMKEYHEQEEQSEKQDDEESNNNLETSDTEVQAESSNINHDRKEFLTAYDNNFGEKIIQPIIIEKEVPVTKYIDRFIETKVPYPQPVEVIKEVEVEKKIHVPVPVETIVEKPVEVTKYVDRPQPYPVQVHHAVPVEVKVPYPVEKNVYIDRPVHVPYPVERIVEKPVLQPVAVPTAIAVPVQVPYEQKVLYPVAVEKHVHVPYAVEKRVPYETIVEKEVPVPYPVEKRVPYPVPYETKVPVPVDRIVERPVTITKYIEKPVHIQVPVPHPVAVPVHVPQPYPVDRIVERKVPYPVHVEKIVERKVPVQVPYPVEKLVEKIVEKPVIITRYIDKPYPVEKRVPYPVEKIVERKVPYAVQVPIEVRVPYAVENSEKPIHGQFKLPYYKPNLPYAYERPDYFLPHLPQQTYTAEQHKQGIPPSHTNLHQSPNQIIPQYLKKLPENKTKLNGPIQTTAWGGLYASSYQYNNTPENHKISFKKTPSFNKYIGYMTNNNQYYGPPPVDMTNHWIQDNGAKNYLVEFKLRRTDRTPRVSNLRIEYGGFKPPLVPSTEVDLDGLPVKHENEKE